MPSVEDAVRVFSTLEILISPLGLAPVHCLGCCLNARMTPRKSAGRWTSAFGTPPLKESPDKFGGVVRGGEGRS